MPLPELIKELDSGVLKIWSLTGKRYYLPNCDLDKALTLLYDFYELRDAEGRRLKDNYWSDGWNWFPAVISHLFWRCFYRFVQYEGPIRSRIAKRQRAFFVNSLNYKKLCKMVEPERYPLDPAQEIDQILEAHNRELSERLTPDVLFYSATAKNFRTKQLENEIKARGLSFAYLLSPSKGDIEKRNDLDSPVYFIHRKTKVENLFNKRYDTSAHDPAYAFFLDCLVAQVEEYLSNRVLEYRKHLEIIPALAPKLLLGMDDVNEIHPVLYACKKNNIPTCGYMVGMYGLRQAAFSLEHIGADEYQWFDKLIVWGEYWREMLGRYSDAYRDTKIVIGANKHQTEKKRLSSPEHDPKNVLVPYEYFANTGKVGEYIKKFIDNGYRVFFKARPDSPPKEQLECYVLGDYESRVEVVTSIDDEFMGKINIVAGSMSTFLFDMLPYGKETWILDTEFRLLDEFTKSGTIRLVTLDEIGSITPSAHADIDHRTGRFDAGVSIQETIEQEIMPMISGGRP